MSSRVERANANSGVGYVLLLIGIIFVAISLDYTIQISALIGTSLFFWGIILLYFRNTRQVPKELLDNSVQSYYYLFHQCIQNIDEKIFYYYTPFNIFGLNNTILVSEKELNYDNKKDINKYDYKINDDINILYPPGHKLSSRIELIQKIQFSETNMDQILSSFEYAFLSELNIAKNMIFDINKLEINVKIQRSIFVDLYSQTDISDIVKKIGDPMVSAIACGISRSTHKSVHIQELKLNNNEIDVTYVMIENNEDT